MLDKMKGRDSMTPPRSRINIGSGDFRKMGQEFKAYFIDLADLQPHHKVLDVGCGIGRMAVPLTSFLNSEGEFYGFDIVKRDIRWCQERIAPRFSNFHFLYSDVYNQHYNPEGKVKAKDYKFPYRDRQFDFVFLTSVFTHMLTEDMHNYLREISRVLKPDGRCLITFFVLNEESKKCIKEGKSRRTFKYPLEGCTIDVENDPEMAVAYDENELKALFAANNLDKLSFYYGSWCGRDKHLSYQDIIVAKKGI